MKDELSDSIEKLKKRKDFFGFDRFIIGKMMEKDLGPEEEIPPIQRSMAYHKCLALMGEQRVAAIQTIQKWFGIHGKTVPTREMVFRLGFSLHLSVGEISDYLVRGLREPDFQVNDYREVILVYGLEHRFTYDEALALVAEFEGMLPMDLEISQHNHTDDLLEDFQIKSKLSKEEFLQWMLENGEEFKGYSKTVLDYFKLYKEEILREVREDAKHDLETLLKQTSYYQWQKRRPHPFKKEKKSILQYIRSERRSKNGCISDEMEKNLMEMLELATVPVQSNSELLAELYASVSKKVHEDKEIVSGKRFQEKHRADFNFMSDKYLSDLLNVAVHKERQIRLSLCQGQMRKYGREELCPVWIQKELRSFGYPEQKMTIEESILWLQDKRKEQMRRCRILQREDLLPLILCVSQKRHLKAVPEEGSMDSQKARESFVSLANTTLSACHMELLQPEKYEFDAVLMLCYGKENWYFLSDVLEELTI